MKREEIGKGLLRRYLGGDDFAREVAELIHRLEVERDEASKRADEYREMWLSRL